MFFCKCAKKAASDFLIKICECKTEKLLVSEASINLKKRKKSVICERKALRMRFSNSLCFGGQHRLPTIQIFARLGYNNKQKKRSHKTGGKYYGEQRDKATERTGVNNESTWFRVGRQYIGIKCTGRSCILDGDEKRHTEYMNLGESQDENKLEWIMSAPKTQRNLNEK